MTVYHLVRVFVVMHGSECEHILDEMCCRRNEPLLGI
jgi:hypothetical protein